MKKLTVYAFIVLLAACNKNAAIEENPIDNGSLIDSKIKVSVKEYLNTQKLVLYCATQKAYPCVNYHINTEQNFKENNKLSVTFTGVPETQVCLTAIGPATAEIDLSTLRNGQYVIELNNLGVKNEGLLKISDTELILDFKDQKSIEIITPVTKRVTAQTYWGTIGYARASSENAVNQFIEKLKNIGAAFNKQVPGYYYHYQIDNDGAIVYDAQRSGYYFAKGLIFQYNAEESKLKNLIQTDGKELYKDDVYIGVFTYKGEQFYNWGK
ncbi:hypothetical protein [Niabella hibiscisoli]|uniref:hypothetical protein n=1 Tax=Niabella hibiscisoli TaxID=1825928 RepID=UPI001F108D09|nr:hypothetical protein [Niabella hibiscisoli]MCH5715981.1 hypothetical protein [Niabella hibiscisoli]